MDQEEASKKKSLEAAAAKRGGGGGFSHVRLASWWTLESLEVTTTRRPGRQIVNVILGLIMKPKARCFFLAGLDLVHFDRRAHATEAQLSA